MASSRGAIAALLLLLNASLTASRPWEVPKVPCYNIPGVPDYSTIPQDIPGLPSTPSNCGPGSNPVKAAEPSSNPSPPPSRVQFDSSPPGSQGGESSPASSPTPAQSSSSSASLFGLPVGSRPTGGPQVNSFLASTDGENARVNPLNGTVTTGQGNGTTIDGQYYGSGAGPSPSLIPSGTGQAGPGSTSQPSSSEGQSGGGPVYKATITSYGSGDSFGSSNCAASQGACGFMISNGFAAAVSEALYGVMGNGGAGGSSCGKCVRITGNADSNGSPKTYASIVLRINNLCPRQGNSLCAQNTLSDTNQLGANVNIDVCKDSTHNGVSATQAFFGNPDGGLAIGTAQIVPCTGNWDGQEGSRASWAPDYSSS